MSDTVDDLHNAEDHISLLKATLRELVEASLLVPGNWKVHFVQVATLAEPYCRPSCSFADTGECDADDPECCGCPCGHNGEESP